MTTPMTKEALAELREKFEGWAGEAKLSLAYGDCGYVWSSTEAAWRAWVSATSDSLDELEAKEKRIAELEHESNSAAFAGMVEDYETKLAELLSCAESAKQRVVELESRKVIIYYPFHIDGDKERPLCVLVESLKSACDHAGITLQIQGGE